MKLPRSWLRIVAWIEGLSFLLLLGLAMPLKYAAGQPLWVKVMGWIHGALFVLLCVILLGVMIRHRWPMRRGVLVFIAALIPFGPFIFDRRIEGYESQKEQAA